MSNDKTLDATRQAVRHLIVCDTQFAWNGSTTLKLQEMMDLQARGWIAEGEDNLEFNLTEAGEEVVARALESGAPATLATAKHGGCVQLATVPYDRARELIGDAYNAGTHGIGYSQQAMELHDAVITAQPSPGGQGDALLPCPFCGESLTINGAGDGVHPRDSDCILAQHVVVADHAPHAAAWNRRALAARQPVGELVEATDAMVEAALQSTVANNAAPWRQVVASEDHADFISDMRAAINAALAARPSPITAEATTTSTQAVPDHCDRIFWQHNYYQLPVGPTDQKKPTKRRQAAVEALLNLGFLWRNDAWIAPPAQAEDLGQLKRFELFADEGPGLGGMSVDYEETDTGAWVRFDDVKALIDSQAVGK